MTNIAKISVALTPEMAEMVRTAVDSGEYASGSEVIREALREWRMRRSLSPQDRSELARLWREGIESGPGRPVNIGAIKREGRRRLAARASKLRR
ncbi:MAG: type II toxin-antitoxin system ParD family antitoxin [Acidobacteriota bacterium]